MAEGTKMKRTSIMATFVVALFAVSSVKANTDDSTVLRKSEAIQAYMGACVSTRANLDAVKGQAKKMGFVPLSGESAQKYLSGNRGLVWSKRAPMSGYTLTLLANGVCSLFVHKGDPSLLQASMEAWLPPSDSGFTYKKSVISKRGPLTATQYQIFRSAVMIEQWVIATNSQANTGLAAIMSVHGA